MITLGIAFIKDLQWDLVSEVAHFISNPQEQANILQQLGLAICKAQRWDQTKTIWHEIRKVSALPEEDEGDIQASTDIYFDWASQIKVIVLIELGLQLYKAQRCEQAKKIWREVETLIHKERDGWLKAELLRNLGIVLAQYQQWQWAEAVAYAISANWAKTEVLIELSLQFHKAHYYDSAEKLEEEIEKNICMIKEYPMKAKELQQQGTMFFITGKEKHAEEIWNQAKKVIYMIPKEQAQDEALGIFTHILIQAQQWEFAQEIAYKIKMSEYKARILIELGTFLAQAKLWKRAEAVWKEAKKQAFAIQDYSESIITLIKLSTTLAQTGRLEQAKSICTEIIALIQKDTKYINKLNVLEELFDLLVLTDSYDKILFITQDTLLQISSKEEAIALFPLAFKLIHLKPEIGVSFYKSFCWVDNLSKG